jgi:hypothetical protein
MQMPLKGPPMRVRDARAQPNLWPLNLPTTLDGGGEVIAVLTINHTTATQIRPPSISNPMLNLNRRYAAALEKSAKADERLANAEESIASSLRDILHGKDTQSNSRPCKNVTTESRSTAKGGSHGRQR